MGCLRMALWANRVYGDGASPLRRGLAQLIKNANRVVFAADIGLGADIPATCRFPHQGLGTVIHPKAVLGERCTVYQGVTVAQDARGGVPSVGDDVMIGANSTLIGAIRIGDFARVGAGSVVTHDVPDRATVAGVPAVVIRRDPKGER